MNDSMVEATARLRAAVEARKKAEVEEAVAIAELAIALASLLRKSPGST